MAFDVSRRCRRLPAGSGTGAELGALVTPDRFHVLCLDPADDTVEHEFEGSSFAGQLIVGSELAAHSSVASRHDQPRGDADRRQGDALTDGSLAKRHPDPRRIIVIVGSPNGVVEVNLAG
jgi:hypothetical protein